MRAESQNQIRRLNRWQKKQQNAKDLQCWGDKFGVSVSSVCQRQVEKLAKYSFEWTDKTLETKFSHFRWMDKSKGYLTYIGDKIKFQNGLEHGIMPMYMNVI